VSQTKQTQSLSLELKALEEKDGLGTFEGHAAVFGNVDSYKDIIEPGAFARSIQHRIASTGKAAFPILFNHDPMEPIGVTLSVAEDAKGLAVKGELNLNVQRGREVYALLKQGALSGLSIGFRTIQADMDSAGIRHLKEVQLYEWSPVVFPANELAQTTNVKAEGNATDPDSSELKLHLALLNAALNA